MTIKNQQKLVDGENLNLHHGVSGFCYKNLLGQFCVVAIIGVAIFGILIHQSYADEATLQGEDSRCRIKINHTDEYIDYGTSTTAYSDYYESDKYSYRGYEPNQLGELSCNEEGYFLGYGYSNIYEGCMATMGDDDIYINYQDTNSDYSSYYKSDKYQYGENEPEQWGELRCSTPGEFLGNGYEYPHEGCKVKINHTDEYIDYGTSTTAYSDYYESDKYQYGEDAPNQLGELSCGTEGYFLGYGYSNTDQGCMATMGGTPVYIDYGDTNSDYSSYYKSDKYQYGENEPEQWGELRCSTPGEFLGNGYDEYPHEGCKVKIDHTDEYIDYGETYDGISYYESDKYDYGQDEPNKLGDLICSTPGHFFGYGYSNTDEGCMATMGDTDIYINYQDTNSDYSSYYKSDKYQYGENEPEQWGELRCSTPGEFLGNGYEYPHEGCRIKINGSNEYIDYEESYDYSSYYESDKYDYGQDEPNKLGDLICSTPGHFFGYGYSDANEGCRFKMGNGYVNIKYEASTTDDADYSSYYKSKTYNYGADKPDTWGYSLTCDYPGFFGYGYSDVYEGCRAKIGDDYVYIDYGKSTDDYSDYYNSEAYTDHVGTLTCSEERGFLGNLYLYSCGEGNHEEGNSCVPNTKKENCIAGTIENGNYTVEQVDVTWNPLLNNNQGGWDIPACIHFTCNTNYHEEGDVCVADAIPSQPSGSSYAGGGGGSSSSKSSSTSSYSSADTKASDTKVADKTNTSDKTSDDKKSSTTPDTKVDTVVKEGTTSESNGSKEEDNTATSQTVSTVGYSQEQVEAYQFAKSNGITTKPTIKAAKMNTNITRIEMANMLSNYAINVLKKVPDTSRTMKFRDVSSRLDKKYDNAVTKAYQLGIMGINMEGNRFRPYDKVPRAEFVTVLSRMMYEISDGEGEYQFYEPHMAKLYNEGIINNVDPRMKEDIGNIMIMLNRVSK